MTNHTTPPGDPDAPKFTSDRVLSAAEASKVTKLDRKTVMTRLQKGAYPNAWKDETGRQGWNIPVKDLVAAGDLDAAKVVDVPAVLGALRESLEVAKLRAHITELETTVQVQTTLADERCSTIQTLQSVLTALIARGSAA